MRISPGPGCGRGELDELQRPLVDRLGLTQQHGSHGGLREWLPGMIPAPRYTAGREPSGSGTTATQLISTSASGTMSSVTPTAVQAGSGSSKISAATRSSAASWSLQPHVIRGQADYLRPTDPRLGKGLAEVGEGAADLLLEARGKDAVRRFSSVARDLQGAARPDRRRNARLFVEVRPMRGHDGHATGRRVPVLSPCALLSSRSLSSARPCARTRRPRRAAPRRSSPRSSRAPA